MKKEGTGINLALEAKILWGRDWERERRRKAQIGWYPYTSPLEQQLNEIWESQEFNKNIGQLDRMLADITDSGELVRTTRQVILTYAEIWNKDIQSGFDTNYPSFDFFSQMKEMKVQLGAEEFEKQRREVSDWHSEMRQRVRSRFVEVLGEIIVNRQIPALVQKWAKLIYKQLA